MHEFKDWIPLLVFIASLISGVIWYLVRRRVSRLDALESAVFGDSGVREKLHKYVTHDVLERRLGEVALAMRGISEEGVRREERILKAIENQTLVIGSEVMEIKHDIRSQNARIDMIVTNQANNNR